MIIGLTHTRTESGQLVPVTELAVGIKVSIGLPKDSKRNHPEKLDHFRITTKSKSGDWVENTALTNQLKEAAGLKPDQQLRRLPICLMSDDIEKAFRTRNAWFSLTEMKCHGDGEKAWRSSTIVPKEMKQDGQRWIPWSPCSEGGCKDYHKDGCRPSGDLFFVLQDFPVLGSVCMYHTSGRRSVRWLTSSLNVLKNEAQGRLRMIPVDLVITPGKTRWEEQGKARSGSAFFVHVEFRPGDKKGLMRELLSSSLNTDLIKARAERELRLIGASSTIVDEDEPEVTPLTEEEEARTLQPEFYPTSEDEPTTDQAELDEKDKVFTETFEENIKKLGLNQGTREAILVKFNGEMKPSSIFLDMVQRAVEKIKPNQATIDDWVKRGLQDPSWLAQYLDKLAHGETKPTVETPPKRRSRKKEESSPPADEPPHPADQVDQAKDQPAEKAAAPKEQPAAGKTNGKAAEESAPPPEKPSRKKWTNF